MKPLIAIPLLLAFMGIVSARSGAQPALSIGGSEITATVRLVDESTNRPEKDMSGVAVWLVPLSGGTAPRQERPRYRMLQHDKHFEPHLLVVPVGSDVEFPNLDPWFHNVFSMYRGKRFDLGLYQAGDKKTVRFDRPGPSYIFCNIHPEMTAVVLAVHSSYIGVSDAAGRIAIKDVPPGDYQIRVWYERASADALDGLQRKIAVGEKPQALGPLAITVEKNRTEAHKNKYGHDYDPKTLDPQY